MNDTKQKQVNMEQRHSDAYKAYLASTKASSSLRRHVQALSAFIDLKSESDGQGRHRISQLLQRCENDITTQQAAQESMLALIPSSVRENYYAPHSAEEVFSTPEILEHILWHLPADDLLSVYEVNKTWSGTIEGSLKLQRSLGLVSHAQSDYFMPAEPLMQRTRYIHTGNTVHKPWFNICEQEDDYFRVLVGVGSYGCCRATLKLPKLGRRCWKMLISQPPPKEVQLYAYCCAWPTYRRDGNKTTQPSKTIVSETGVAVGQIYDAIAEVRAHTFCLDDDWRCYDKQGLLYRPILVRGLVSLKDDDPVHREKDMVDHQEEELMAWKKRVLKYCDAKVAAHEHGKSIRTFAEFEAAKEAKEAGLS